MLNMAPKKYTLMDNLDNKQLHALSQKFAGKATDFFDLFDLEHTVHYNRIAGPCPVHGGDNIGALSFFTEGESTVGNWCCWTHHCEDDYTNSALGFARGVLSNQYGRSVSFKETIDFVCKFLKCSLDTLDISDNLERDRFIKIASDNDEKTVVKTKVLRRAVRQSLKYPAEYFINRGYTEETLNKFDVGICINKKKPMYGRVVVPVYDDGHHYMIGCLGRTIQPQCSKCNLFHHPCPSTKMTESVIEM